MLGRLLCKIGLHRWVYTTERVGAWEQNWARCRRPGCPRYSEWDIVNKERWRL